MPDDLKNPRDEMPPVNTPVQCLLQFTSGKLSIAELIHVDEDDVTWRTADDRSELNEMAVDVLSWTAIAEQPEDPLRSLAQKTGPLLPEDLDLIRSEVDEIKRDLDRHIRRAQYYSDLVAKGMQRLQALPAVLENISRFTGKESPSDV